MSKQTDAAYEYIREKIFEGTLKPAQKLVELQLAQQIGVSRNTIKKAFLKLQQENLVDLEDNKGATVKSFTLEEVVNYLEIREVLEGLVARSAAKNIKDTDLHEMKRIVEEMKIHLANNHFDKYSECNKAFHALIYDCANNIQAVDLIKMIRTQLIRYQFRTIFVPGRSQTSHKEHSDIYHALLEHDERLAEEAVRKHVIEVRRTIEKNYHFLL